MSDGPSKEWDAAYNKFKAALETFVSEAHGSAFVPTDWTCVIAVMDMSKDRPVTIYSRPSTEMFPHAIRGLHYQALSDMEKDFEPYE